MRPSRWLFATALSLAIALSMSSTTSAQTPLLVENFNYPAGSLLTANGWTAHSGAGTNPLTTVAPALTYTGYPSSGLGNAVAMTTSGEDAHKTFAVQSTGSVYAAFLVNLSEASTDPAASYFFHLGPDPISTTFRGRLFAKKDASNNVAFGITKALTTQADIAYTPFSYALNTTYLIVVKYSIVEGTANDTVSIYINPTLNAEPATTTATATDVSQSDVNIGSVALRQGSAATAPTLKIGGLRIGTSWASVMTGGAPAATQNVVDFNGDGKTDFTVVRNVGGGPNGQVRWFTNFNSSATTVAFDWGLSTDFFVPADYDGDNKTDIAVWRPISAGGASGNAFFYIYESATGTVRIVDFGQTGDDPSVVGDYDGDGKADPAVYREGELPSLPSFWFFRGSQNNPSGNISYNPWGVNGDFPAPGDYDGDGKNDFVIQRNNGDGQARFWMLQTTAGLATVSFGTPTDLIAPGDYDGDGKTDIAVVRGIGGQYNWFVIPSTTGVISPAPFAVFGATATDFVTQGDYDGDGKTDAAVWRSSATPGLSAFWYQGSAGGVNAVPFGQAGDYPVANYNVH